MKTNQISKNQILVPIKDKLNERDYSNMAMLIVSSFITDFFNDEVKHTLLYKRKLKSVMKMLRSELQSAVKLYDNLDMVEQNKELTDKIMLIMPLLMKSKTPFDFITKTEILAAWEKDPKRLEGIATKILNNK